MILFIYIKNKTQILNAMYEHKIQNLYPRCGNEIFLHFFAPQSNKKDFKFQQLYCTNHLPVIKNKKHKLPNQKNAEHK